MTFDQPPIPPTPPGSGEPPYGSPTPPLYGSPAGGPSTPGYNPPGAGDLPPVPGQAPGAPGYAAPPATTPPAAGAPQYGSHQQPATGSGWGTPAGTPKPAFNPSTVNPLDWGIIAAGFLALVFSFFSYYTATAKVTGFSFSVHENAWHGFFGWFAALLALASAGLLAATIFAPGQLRLPLPVRLAVLAGFAVATLCVLLAWFVTPGVAGGGTAGLDIGRGIGFYLSLIVIIAGLVLSVMRLRSTGGKLPWENRAS
ncbi:MAG: hypothetical protein ABJB98_10450 [Actinomycetota bacterium]